MDKVQKEALQVTKEIVVKFIETGRVSPQNITEIFPAVYNVVQSTLEAGHSSAPSEPDAQTAPSSSDQL